MAQKITVTKTIMWVTPPPYKPAQEKWDLIVEKFKALRLHGLQHSPEAFSATFETELNFPFDKWRDRLGQSSVKDPQVRQFFAVTLPEDKAHLALPEDVADSGDFAGMVVLIYPRNSAGLPILEHEEQVGPLLITFEMSALYVRPDKRGLGLGKKLVEAARQVAMEWAQMRRPVDVAIFVHIKSENESARDFYEKLGFQAVGSDASNRIQMAWSCRLVD